MEKKYFIAGRFEAGLSIRLGVLIDTTRWKWNDVKNVLPPHITFKTPFMASDAQIKLLSGKLSEYVPLISFENLIRFSSVEEIISNKLAFVVDQLSQKELKIFQENFYAFLKENFFWMSFSDYDKQKRHYLSFLKSSSAREIIPYVLEKFPAYNLIFSMYELCIFEQNEFNTLVSCVKFKTASV